MKKYSACEDIYHAVECVDNSEKRSDIFNLISIDGDVEFYIASEADEEIRATRHALWMARASKAEICKLNWEDLVKKNPFIVVEISGKEAIAREMFKRWQLVERKCREKAEEYR